MPLYLTRDTKAAGGDVKLWHGTRRRLELSGIGRWRDNLHMVGSCELLGDWWHKPRGFPPVRYGKCKRVKLIEEA